MEGSSSWSTRPGVEDGPVLLAHRVRAGEDELLVGLVVLVADARGAAGGDRRHEALVHARRGERRLHVLDIGADGVAARVDERTPAHGQPHAGTAAIGRDAGIRIGVRGGEQRPVAPIGEAREPDAARLGALRRDAVELHAELEPAEALERIAPPRAVVHALAHGLAELAVARHVDARRPLAPDDLDDGGRQPRLVGGLVTRLAGLPCAIQLDEIVWPRKAAGLSGEDASAALLHGGPQGYRVRRRKARVAGDGSAR